MNFVGDSITLTVPGFLSWIIQTDGYGNHIGDGGCMDCIRRVHMGNIFIIVLHKPFMYWGDYLNNCQVTYFKISAIWRNLALIGMLNISNRPMFSYRLRCLLRRGLYIWDPAHQCFFWGSWQFTPWKNLLISLNDNDEIMIWFCTCNDSLAAVTCAKFVWQKRFMRFPLWAYKPL